MDDIKPHFISKNTKWVLKRYLGCASKFEFFIMEVHMWKLSYTLTTIKRACQRVIWNNWSFFNFCTFQFIAVFLQRNEIHLCILTVFEINWKVCSVLNALPTFNNFFYYFLSEYTNGGLNVGANWIIISMGLAPTPFTLIFSIRKNSINAFISFALLTTDVFLCLELEPKKAHPIRVS